MLSRAWWRVFECWNNFVLWSASSHLNFSLNLAHCGQEHLNPKPWKSSRNIAKLQILEARYTPFNSSRCGKHRQNRDWKNLKMNAKPYQCVTKKIPNLVIDLSFTSIGLIVSSGVGPLRFSFRIQCQWFIFTGGTCSEVVFEFEWRAPYFGSLRAPHILAPLGMPRWTYKECSSFQPPNYLQAYTKNLPNLEGVEIQTKPTSTSHQKACWG